MLSLQRPSGLLGGQRGFTTKKQILESLARLARLQVDFSVNPEIIPESEFASRSIADESSEKSYEKSYEESPPIAPLPNKLAGNSNQRFLRKLVLQSPLKGEKESKRIIVIEESDTEEEEEEEEEQKEDVLFTIRISSDEAGLALNELLKDAISSLGRRFNDNVGKPVLEISERAKLQSLKEMLKDTNLELTNEEGNSAGTFVTYDLVLIPPNELKDLYKNAEAYRVALNSGNDNLGRLVVLPKDTQIWEKETDSYARLTEPTLGLTMKQERGWTYVAPVFERAPIIRQVNTGKRLPARFVGTNPVYKFQRVTTGFFGFQNLMRAFTQTFISSYEQLQEEVSKANVNLPWESLTFFLKSSANARDQAENQIRRLREDSSADLTPQPTDDWQRDWEDRRDQSEFEEESDGSDGSVSPGSPAMSEEEDREFGNISSNSEDYALLDISTDEDARILEEPELSLNERAERALAAEQIAEQKETPEEKRSRRLDASQKQYEDKVKRLNEEAGAKRTKIDGEIKGFQKQIVQKERSKRPLETELARLRVTKVAEINKLKEVLQEAEDEYELKFNTDTDNEGKDFVPCLKDEKGRAFAATGNGSVYIFDYGTEGKPSYVSDDFLPKGEWRYRIKRRRKKDGTIGAPARYIQFTLGEDMEYVYDENQSEEFKKDGEYDKDSRGVPMQRGAKGTLPKGTKLTFRTNENLASGTVEGKNKGRARRDRITGFLFANKVVVPSYTVTKLREWFSLVDPEDPNMRHETAPGYGLGLLQTKYVNYFPKPKRKQDLVNWVNPATKPKMDAKEKLRLKKRDIERTIYINERDTRKIIKEIEDLEEKIKRVEAQKTNVGNRFGALVEEANASKQARDQRIEKSYERSLQRRRDRAAARAQRKAEMVENRRLRKAEKKRAKRDRVLREIATKYPGLGSDLQPLTKEGESEGMIQTIGNGTTPVLRFTADTMLKRFYKGKSGSEKTSTIKVVARGLDSEGIECVDVEYNYKTWSGKKKNEKIYEGPKLIARYEIGGLSKRSGYRAETAKLVGVSGLSKKKPVKEIQAAWLSDVQDDIKEGQIPLVIKFEKDRSYYVQLDEGNSEDATLYTFVNMREEGEEDVYVFTDKNGVEKRAYLTGEGIYEECELKEDDITLSAANSLEMWKAKKTSALLRQDIAEAVKQWKDNGFGEYTSSRATLFEMAQRATAIEKKRDPKLEAEFNFGTEKLDAELLRLIQDVRNTEITSVKSRSPFECFMQDDRYINIVNNQIKSNLEGMNPEKFKSKIYRKKIKASYKRQVFQSKWSTLTEEQKAPFVAESKEEKRRNAEPKKKFLGQLQTLVAALPTLNFTDALSLFTQLLSVDRLEVYLFGPDGVVKDTLEADTVRHALGKCATMWLKKDMEGELGETHKNWYAGARADLLESIGVARKQERERRDQEAAQEVQRAAKDAEEMDDFIASESSVTSSSDDLDSDSDDSDFF